jgi:hypothetical protein
MTDKTDEAVSFDWNEEHKVGSLWVFERNYIFRGHDNEQSARAAASRRLSILRRSLGPTVPALPRQRTGRSPLG